MGKDRKGQLHLFGEPEPHRKDETVGTATATEEQRRIAAELPRNVRLGTSSWSFPGWEGLVYDRAATKSRLAKHGLAAYAGHCLLRAVGIDRTFYAPIPAPAFAEYAAAVPDDFRFLVKASGECTSLHRRDGTGRPTERNELFLDAGYATQEVVGPFVEGLGEKAGPLVFQFPPLGAKLATEPARFAEMLGEFLTALPAGPLYAVELRDGDLIGADYRAALEEAKASHCFSVHPRVPPISDQVRALGLAAGAPLVVRWMLHAGLVYEEAQHRYEPFSRLVDEDRPNRDLLADLSVERVRGGGDVFLIANNKAEGSAPLTVFKLAERIVERRNATGS